jgi:hypothetical protein
MNRISPIKTTEEMQDYISHLTDWDKHKDERWISISFLDEMLTEFIEDHIVAIGIGSNMIMISRDDWDDFKALIRGE